MNRLVIVSNSGSTATATRSSAGNPSVQLQSLQIGRGIAALLVVMYHLGGAIAAPKYFGVPFLYDIFAWAGAAGVDFFFVLSGFIIASVHARDIGRPARLPAYLYKRFMRIYPIYWIVLIGVGALAYLVPGAASGHPTTLAIALETLALFPQDPAVTGGTGAPIIIVAWSLQYEMLFYACFGLLILGRTFAVVLLAGAAALAAAAGIAGIHIPLGFLHIEYFALFAFGIVVAVLTRAGWPPQVARTSALAGSAGFLVTAAMVTIGEVLPHAAPRVPLTATTLAFGASASLIVYGLVIKERNGWKPRWKAGVLLGDVSYALYLVHFPIISAACKIAVGLGLAGFAGAAMSAMAILVACIATALVVHAAIERPIMDLAGRRRLRGFVSGVSVLGRASPAAQRA